MFGESGFVSWEVNTFIFKITENLFAELQHSIMILNSVAGHQYETRVADAFVISSNDAILSCSLPSFASEYLLVTAWVTSQGEQVSRQATGLLGNRRI